MLGRRRRGGASRFSVQNFFVSVPNHFIEEPFCVSEVLSQYRIISKRNPSVSEKFTYWKILCQRGEYHDFLLKICCLRVPKKLRRGNLLCFAKFLVSKNFMDKRGGGGGGREYHDFMSKFLSHSTESVRRGTLLCLRKFHVSKNFMFKKRISRFSIEKLLSHSTEKFRRGTLLCFRSFVSVPNHFVEESLRQKVSPIEKFYA